MPVGDLTFELVCRSSLPYDLRFSTKQAVRDPETRVLEASMAGDLDGFSRWTITAGPHGTSATFDEEVVANLSRCSAASSWWRARRSRRTTRR